MNFKILIQGKATSLVSIDESDAENICMLRNQPSISKYLSNIDKVTIEQQVLWTRNYIEQNDGVYLKILDRATNRFLGTISIYNVDYQSRTAEFGRYICISPLHAIESELLIVEFAFKIMGLEKIFCRTAQLNSKVWKQHQYFGFKDAGEEYFKEKNLTLRIQEVTKTVYYDLDLERITKIIDKLSIKA